MKDIVKFNQVENKLIVLNKQQVMLDFDVAALYEVVTKRINEAVRNNPEKFPSGYVIELKRKDLPALRSKFSTANLSKSRYMPKAFTEKGLYMLATVLKSPKATETTLAIIETFAKVREFSRTLSAFTVNPEKEEQQNLIKKGTDILSEIIGEELEINSTETSIELNLAVLKLKHTVKRK